MNTLVASVLGVECALVIGLIVIGGVRNAQLTRAERRAGAAPIPVENVPPEQGRRQNSRGPLQIPGPGDYSTPPYEPLREPPPRVPQEHRNQQSEPPIDVSGVVTMNEFRKRYEARYGHRFRPEWWDL